MEPTNPGISILISIYHKAYIYLHLHHPGAYGPNDYKIIYICKICDLYIYYDYLILQLQFSHNYDNYNL